MVHPDLQAQLLSCQSLGRSADACLEGVISWLQQACAAPAAELLGLVLAQAGQGRFQPAGLMSELLAISDQGGLLGLLVWQCLALNVVTAEELFALPSAAELLVASLQELSAAMPSAPFAAATPAGAQPARAFAALVRLLATCAPADPAKRTVAQVTRSLRGSWGAAPAAGGRAGAGAVALQGVQLLARLVRVLHSEVFPRQRATSWVEAELAAVLQAPATPLPAEAEAHWVEAMEAFAAGLSLDTLLAQVQQALLLATAGGSAGAGPLQLQQQVGRCAQLLAAAAAASPAAAASVRAWVAARAAVGVAQRDAAAVVGVLRLQRQLSGSTEAYQDWLRTHLLLGPARGEQGGGGAAAGDLQFLVQAVLMPLLPEEADAALLEAQAAALAGMQDLPASAARVVGDYNANAQQRLWALAAQAAQGAGGPGAPPLQGANLVKGQQQAEELLKEFRLHKGRLLSPATLQGLAARYSNPFQFHGIEGQLVPALLAATRSAAEMEERVALMQYLHQALPAHPAKLRARFGPEAVRAFRQRCLLAQLDSATLSQLAAQLAALAAEPPAAAAAAAAAAAPPGGAGAAGPAAEIVGSLSLHLILDRMGVLVKGEVAKLSPSEDSADAGSALDGLAELLLNAFCAAYIASLGATTAQRSSAAALTAHLLTIFHEHWQLHGPLLGRVEHLVLEAGAAGQLDPQQALSLAMLAATMGALIAEPLPATLGSGQEQQQRQERRQTAAAPLFSWHAEHGSGEPGPSWLARLLRRLLARGGTAGVSWACRFCAALLSCLRHFHCAAALADPAATASSGGSWGSWEQLGNLMVLPRSISISSGGPGKGVGYEGEWVRRLAYPLCPAALQLLLWVQLRLTVAGQVAGPSVGAPSSDEQRGKRPRLETSSRPGSAGSGGSKGLGSAESAAQQVQQLCQAVLEGELGRELVEATGPLSQAAFLHLEAATAGSGGDDLVAPLDRDAVLRAVCGEFLRLSLPAAVAERQQEGQEGQSSLAQLLQPLALLERAVGEQQQQWEQQQPLTTEGTAPQLGSEPGGGDFVPDSEDEGEGGSWGVPAPAAAPVAPTAAPVDSHAGGSGDLSARMAEAAAEEVAQAVVRLVAAPGGSSPGNSSSCSTVAGALTVLQAASAHMLRLLLPLSSAGLEPCGGKNCGEGSRRSVELLVTFLLKLVRGCQRGAAARTAPLDAPVAAGAAGAALLAFEPASMQRVAELVAALARGLQLELLPERVTTVPLDGFICQGQALAEAVGLALWDASLTDAQVLHKLRHVVAG